MPGEVLTAQTHDGSELAILDVTHPAFSLAYSDDELALMELNYLEDASRQTEISEPLRQALASSTLGNALFASSETFLAGLPSYLLKLGPENLGPAASPIDRRISASFPAICARLRLIDVSRLAASALSKAAATQPDRPICVLNIGGGASADSWNALILTRHSSPDLLQDRPHDRPITITVLDPDATGPSFAANAIRRLAEPGAPLDGLSIGFQHLTASWSQLDQIRATLDALRARESVCVILSEGALFEYGSDDEIVSCLAILHIGTASNAVVVGSVTRESASTKAARRATRAAIRPRTLPAFADLAYAAGWQLQQSITRPFSFHVRLNKP